MHLLRQREGSRGGLILAHSRRLIFVLFLFLVLTRVRAVKNSSPDTIENRPQAVHRPPEAGTYRSSLVDDTDPPLLSRARLRDPIDKPLQQKKVCIEAGPASVEPPVPAITGVYEQRPAGHILHEVLPDHDVSLDPRCPYAVWAGQYLTRLPFIPDPNNPDENALRVVALLFFDLSPNFLIIQQLSPHLERLVADARDARGSPYVDYYTYTEDIVGLGRKIRASMAKGNMAVVEGCPDVHRVELSEPDLLTHLHIQSQERFTAHGQSTYDLFCPHLNHIFRYALSRD